MELIKMNLESHMKRQAQKSQNQQHSLYVIYSSLRTCQYRVRQLLSVQAAVIATPHQESQNP